MSHTRVGHHEAPGRLTAQADRLGHDRVLQAALAMILLQLAFRAWATYGSWFHIDDFNFVSRMLASGPDPVSASQSYYGHVMPAAMYLSWLNNDLAPWNWNLPATELLALQAVADLGLLVALRSLVGWRPGILPPLALFLFSAISVPPSIWWAAAINLLPLEIALFLALVAHLRYLRTGQVRFAVVANLVVLAGIAFNEKTVLVYAALGIVTLCWFTTGRGLARVRDVLVRWRSGVLVYAVTLAAYSVIYLLLADDLKGDTSRLGYPLVDVLKNMVFYTSVPGLVGGPLRWWEAPDQPGSLASPHDIVVLLSCVALVWVLREILRARSRAARALLLPGFFLLVDTVLVSVTRAPTAGTAISLDYRYQGELAAVAALALACATMPIRGAVEQVSRRGDSELLDRPPRAALATVAMSLLGLVSSVGYVTHWQDDHQAEQYVQRLVPQLESAPVPVPLIDAPVPLTITNGTRYPENLLSRIFAAHADRTDFPTTATDHLSMVDDQGRVVPVVVPDARRGRPGPRKECGYRIGSRPVTIRLDGPVVYGGWWVRIGYIATGDSPVRITTGDTTRTTRIEAGLHALYVAGGGQFDEIEVSELAHGVSLCTDDVTVGRPVPRTEFAQ